MASMQMHYPSYQGAQATRPRSVSQRPIQATTHSLLNGIHTSYTSGEPFSLEPSTSVVVNTWRTIVGRGLGGMRGGTVDAELARRAWEHARRRFEDGCIVLASLHESTPSLFAPFLSALPLNIPMIFYTALAALQPLVSCVTPLNPSAVLYSSLGATFTCSVSGILSGATLKISRSGLDLLQGLTKVPSKPGYRAFDVFYYILSSATSPREREALTLQSPSSYSLLKRSDTYDPPSFLPTTDDAASAEEFRHSLKAIGIIGQARIDFLSCLTALLKLGDTLDYLLGEEEQEGLCADVAGLLGLDPDVLIRQCNDVERETLIAALYEGLVDWVITKANEAIAKYLSAGKRDSSSDEDSRAGAFTPMTLDEQGETISISVVEVPRPQLGKAVALRNIFDDSEGINAEMKADGLAVPPTGQAVLADMNAAVTENEADLAILGGQAALERELERDRREAVLDKVIHAAETESPLRRILQFGNTHAGLAGRFDLATIMESSRVWFQLCLHPTDRPPTALSSDLSDWSAASVSTQLRCWRLLEWSNRRNKRLDFTADFELDEFHARYARLGCKEGRDGIESFVAERGWSNGSVTIGAERVWVREAVWWEAESMLDMLPLEVSNHHLFNYPETGSTFFESPFGDNAAVTGSRDNLVLRSQRSDYLRNPNTLGTQSFVPTATQTFRGDYGLGTKGDDMRGMIDELDPELGQPKVITHEPTTKIRRLWVAIVWSLTGWIPSPLLRFVGQMKRPDIRMAWREKLVIVLIIFFLNALIVFYIIEFGRLLCPNYDKAWNNDEVSEHQGENDFYVSVRGRVYDITKFWRDQHSSIAGETVTDTSMMDLAGLNLNELFPIPLYVGCPGLVSNTQLALSTNATNENAEVQTAFVHRSGAQSPYSTSALANAHWYSQTFMPRMKEYYKGDLVTTKSNISAESSSGDMTMVIINNNVYDLTDYFYTLTYEGSSSPYSFLSTDVSDMIEGNAGSDITSLWNAYAEKNSSAASQNLQCLQNVFYVGKTDFRDTPKCQVNNYILLAFTIILVLVIGVKFFAALQFGHKRRPVAQDKYVICQVPAYTEGEDHLRKGLDSLTALSYDNKRKLICVICDGMITGGGNDRPTPKIVLDILGVDPKVDPPALPFKSVGQGNEQLNYGKVYSGLYEFEGNVVPYIIVVKVGREAEQHLTKPGNRGKRDSQILLMSFLNRVHHRAPMSPLELEMYHQINNVIGVPPELYEYLFMVDADTMVKEDALTRLVASCSNDAKIAGICGETSLENQERSWWTMMQVYEYYISHHLAKAFESLFGSVTCLPGCFCMYRLRTPDKGKPLIISDKIISEYSDCNVDTLHKKNLLSLGEDRYLTTLMTKHFPHMSYKFVPDAYAQTAAPETWSILLSQRRRWINSTIHNLGELVFLKDMCGFCFFSMRFVVFIDLFGTIILPATCGYLAYLIYRVATHSGQFPLISIIMIAVVYGLQALIFIIKRKWEMIGWMLIYMVCFPIYSLALPIYAFWKQDDFSWGNTRIVIGEKSGTQVVAVSDADPGFDPRSIPLQRWADYAAAAGIAARHGTPSPGFAGSTYEKLYEAPAYDDANAYELDELRSTYSSVKPASTILTGFRNHSASGLYLLPPTSPGPPITQYQHQHQQQQQQQQQHPVRPPLQQRQSTISAFSHYTDLPTHPPPQQQQQHRPYLPTTRSTSNLLATSPSPSPTPPPIHSHPRAKSPLLTLGTSLSRPSSTLPTLAPLAPEAPPAGRQEPSDEEVVEAVRACLAVVDLEKVTKKGLKALAEQRLHWRLRDERRAWLDRVIDGELERM